MLNSLPSICIYLLVPVVDGGVKTYTFRFEQVNPSQVEQPLSSIKSHKSYEHDKLHSKLIKISAPVIAIPVSRIINSTNISCYYPVRWKMGQITSLFKKGDQLSKKNDRPITVLPVLNNPCERILSNQLVHIERIIAVVPRCYVEWMIGGLA